MHGLRSRQRLPALDGIRGLAVLLVLMLHLLPTYRMAEAGRLGVDMFFALSGFVITRSLLLGYEDDPLDKHLRVFLRARMIRLMPALAAMTVLSVLPCVVLRGFLGLTDWWIQAVLALTFSTNLLFYGHDEFANEHLSVLGPTWSLSVEQHFYLLWPPLLLWMLRRGNSAVALRRTGWLGASIAVLLSAGSITAEASGLTKIASAYFRSEVRLPELLVGCVAALLLAASSRELPAMHNIMYGAVGPALLMSSLLLAAFYGQATIIGSLAEMVAALATVGIITRVVSRSTCWLARLLAASPLVSVGERSYELYLCHVPVIVFMGTVFKLPAPALIALELGVSWLIAGRLRAISLAARNLWHKPLVPSSAPGDPAAHDARR